MIKLIKLITCLITLVFCYLDFSSLETSVSEVKKKEGREGLKLTQINVSGVYGGRGWGTGREKRKL